MYAYMYAFVYDAIECSLNQLSARLPPGERRDGAMDDWWRRDFGGYGGLRFRFEFQDWGSGDIVAFCLMGF